MSDMLPHTINGSPVVAVDFAAGAVLVGKSGGFSRNSIDVHERLRYVDNKWYRAVPPRGTQVQRPKLDDESYRWRESHTYVDEMRIKYVRTYVSIDRAELKRALTQIVKLTGKRLDFEDALLTVEVLPDCMRLTSHGDQCVTAEIRSKGESARDGLGTCVVLGAALKQLVRELTSTRVAVRLDSQRLLVGTSELWTVATAPRSLSMPEMYSFGPGDVAALRRALSCASKDTNRKNIQRVTLRPTEDGAATLEATDGHRAYSEPLAWPRRLPRQVLHFPRDVLESLLAKKKATLQCGVDVAGRVYLHSNDVTVACQRNPLSSPPIHQVMGHDAAAITVLISETEKLLKWADNPEKHIALHIPTKRSAAFKFGRSGSYPCATLPEVTAKHDLYVGIDSRYLHDALIAADGDVTLVLGPASTDPIHVYSEVYGRQTTIMPLRL